MEQPHTGQRWLRKRDNRIVIIVAVRDCGMLVDWQYTEEPDILHTSDGLDFVIWGNFTLIG